VHDYLVQMQHLQRAKSKAKRKDEPSLNFELLSLIFELWSLNFETS
jgi:hypothetical protein